MPPKDPIRAPERDPIYVASLKTETDLAITGQIVVAAAGTAVRGPNVTLENGVYVKALPGNADTAYFGNDGTNDVSVANGYALDAGQQILSMVRNLSELWFDVASGGDGFCWMKA